MLYVWAGAGLLPPAIFIVDWVVNDLRFFRDHTELFLAVWPSSIMLMAIQFPGFWNTAIPLTLSVGVNVALYLLVGFVLSKIVTAVRRAFSL